MTNDKVAKNNFGNDISDKFEKLSAEKNELEQKVEIIKLDSLKSIDEKKLEFELVKYESDLRWKKISLIGTILGAVSASSITLLSTPALLKYISNKNNLGLHSVYPRANDFLATGEGNFTGLLSRTSREVWFVGTSFYISADDHRKLIIKKIQEGISVNFLILDPTTVDFSKHAKVMGYSENELRLICIAGIKMLNSITLDLKGNESISRLSIKLISYPILSRFYIFDPNSYGGFTYIVPQIGGTKSTDLPGFLYKNEDFDLHKQYFFAIQRSWGEKTTVNLEEWKKLNSFFITANDIQ